MTFTGQLGTSLSRLGNIVLGYGGKPAVGISLTGVGMKEIGSEYDFAFGYDNGSGQVNMVGYVLAKDQRWTEGTQLQDIQYLSSVGSPSNTDRSLSYWPKVSQGDWSHGSRQLIFTDATRFYDTDGNIDVTKPGALTLLPARTTANGGYTATFTGGAGYNNKFPLATDGDQYYVGNNDGTVTVGKRDYTTTSVSLPGNGAGINGQVIDIQPGIDENSVPGVFVGTPTGIWFIRGDTLAANTWITSEGVDGSCNRGMAQLNGTLYYLKNGSGHVIRFLNGPLGTPATGNTSPNEDGFIHTLCPTATGLLFATSPNEGYGSIPPTRSLIFTWDGVASPIQIADVHGLVKYAEEVNGTTYMLAALYDTVGKYNYTLYTIVGSTLTVLDDLRSALTDFQAINPSPASFDQAKIWDDGRFVLIGWNGLPGIQLDIVTQGITRVGEQPTGSVLYSHQLVKTRYHGIVEVSVADTTLRVTVGHTFGTSGKITTSYFDFDTPGFTKFFRALEIEMNTPLPGTSSVALEYQLDAQSTWTSIPLALTAVNIITAILPSGTKGNRIRFRITLNGEAAGAPSIRQYAVKATLGRIWKPKVSCLRNQELRNKMLYQGSAQDLIANIELCWINSGRVVAFVPSPTQNVEQVNAVLEDYTWEAAIPGPSSNEAGAIDMEGEVQLVLKEV